MSDRDTHFAGFAELLWREVRKTSFDSPGFSEYQQLEQHLQLLFSRRAYDLAMHVLSYAPYAPMNWLNPKKMHEYLQGIPDMDEQSPFRE